MKFKQQLTKLAIVVILVVGFLLVMNYFQKKEAVVTVDPEKFTIVKSEKELNTKLAQHIPGYELASEYDFVKDIGTEFPLMKENRTLRIDKAWYFRDRLFILYSYDLKNGDDDPKELPSLGLQTVTFDTSNGESHQINVNKDFWADDFQRLENGYVYKNRIYKGKYIFVNELFENENLMRKIANGLEINKITLNQPILKKEKSEGEKVQLENIALNIDVNPEENGTFKKIKLNQDTKLANGDTIHWEELSIGIDSNLLHLTVEPATAKIRSLVFDMEFPEVYKVPEVFSYMGGLYPINYESEGKATVFLPPFREIPNHIQLNISSAEYIGEEKVHYVIPNIDINNFFKESEKERNKEVFYEKEVGRTENYTFTHTSLKRFGFNNKGGTGVKITISQNEKQNAFLNMYVMTNVEYENYLKMVEQDPYNRFSNNWARLNGPVIKFTNEKNEVINTEEHLYNVQQQNAHSLSETIMLDEQDFKAAKEVHMEIFNIPQLVDIKSNDSIKIEIK